MKHPQDKAEPITQIVIKNRGQRTVRLMRDGSGLEQPLDFMQGIGVKVYKDTAFLSINLDNGVVTVDFGSEE